MALYNIVAGTTSALRFQLLEAGAPLDLTNITVTLLLADRNGNVVSNPGTVSIINAVDGRVQLTPTDATIFVSANSPYQARWKLVDFGGKISYVPTGPRDVWDIIGA